MTRLLKLIPLLFIFLSLGCEKKKTALEFEKEVLTEIFPALIDSIWVSSQVTMTPPPVIFNDKKEFVTYGQKDIKQLKKDLNVDLESFKKNNLPLLATILDTIQKIDKRESNELHNHFKQAKIIKENLTDSLKYKIDTQRFNSNKHLKILYTSEIPRDLENYEFNNRRKIYSAISMTRILFDESKIYGILSIGLYRYGNSHGYRVFIKKVKNKWIIDKIEESWIS
jgi:hypothetical protein